MSYNTAAALNSVTSQIIAGSIEVHTEVGPGLFEHAYLTCLCYELRQRGLSLRVQVPIPLLYKTVALECAYRADIVVENAVILEVKALDALHPIHWRQLHTYLRLADRRVGLILNFGAQRMVDGVVRVVNNFPEH